MRIVLIIVLFGVCGFLGFKVFQLDEEIKRLKGQPVEGASADQLNSNTPNEMTVETSRDGGNNSTKTSTRTYSQGGEVQRAIENDSLFAVISKRTIRSENYEDRFDKNSLGNPKTKTHPAVYILKCLGRETRENYLCIVDRAVYDSAKIHEKFTRDQMASFEIFLSEERLEQTVFHRRFRGKMVD